MTIADSYAQFLDDFHAATAELADAIEWYAAPEREHYLDFERAEVEALGRACHRLGAADDNGFRTFDLTAGLQIVRQVAGAFGYQEARIGAARDPEPKPPKRPKLELMH